MARADQAPEEREQPLVLDAFVECPRCEVLQDVSFTAPESVTEQQDLVDAPTAQVTCESCGETWLAVYEGWTSYDDAG